MNTLITEPEAIVRLEAVTAMHCLYVNECFEELKMPQVYQIMVLAATADLSWEVKVKSLEFWEEVICGCLIEQGMIDGSFPEVTFSKECKKIVVLNDAEIKKRMITVLSKLNEYGCLEVLTNAIQEDSDIKVVEKAIEITKNFVLLLKKYKINSLLPDITFRKNSVKFNILNLVDHDLDRTFEDRRKWLTLTDSDDFDKFLDNVLEEIEERNNATYCA